MNMALNIKYKSKTIQSFRTLFRKIMYKLFILIPVKMFLQQISGTYDINVVQHNH